MPLLSPGDAFPSLTLPKAGGGSLRLPDDLGGQFGVVLFYRGSWCPYCNAQLRSFQRAKDDLAELATGIVALSVDGEAATDEMITKLGLTFPIGHSADAQAIAAATGAFVDRDRGYLQSTGFILNATGNVIVSVYSSGAIGRLVPDDVKGLIRYVREHAAAAT